MKNRISIIIPVYNVELYVEECLRSVMAQTYTDIECIIVDDCGTDGSIAVCERVISEYDGPVEFRILHHEHNRGLSAARNTGLEDAKGAYIAFLDSDDFFDPNMFEDLLQLIGSTQADIVTSAITSYKDGKYAPFNWAQSGYKKYKELTFQEFFSAVVNEELDNASWNKLYRRGILTQRFKEGRNNEDYLFFYYLCKEYPTARMTVTDKSYYYYRQREDSICHEKTAGVSRLSISVLQNYIEVLDDKSLPTQTYEKVLRQYQNLLFSIMNTIVLNPSIKNEMDSYLCEWLRNEYWNMRKAHRHPRRMAYYAIKYAPRIWKLYCGLRTK